MKKQKYTVTGMSCAACSARVEKEVSKLDGVGSVAVSLLTNSMTVEFDETKLESCDVIRTVENSGYSASEFVNRTSSDKSDKKVNKKTSLNHIDDAQSELKKRFIISVCFLIPLMYVSMGHMLGFITPDFVKHIFHGRENAITFAFSQLILVLPIMYVNRKYFINGFKNLCKFSPNMDSLIAIGSAAACIYGVFAIFRIGTGLGNLDFDLVDRYSHDVYFESAGTILTLITLGKYLEAKSKSKTRSAIEKLIDMSPKTAIVERNGEEIEIPFEEIAVGDTVVVKTGATVPVDGTVIDGGCSVDESLITGEVSLFIRLLETVQQQGL